jgi:hypothetical protein
VHHLIDVGGGRPLDSQAIDALPETVDQWDRVHSHDGERAKDREIPWASRPPLDGAVLGETRREEWQVPVQRTAAVLHVPNEPIREGPATICRVNLEVGYIQRPGGGPAEIDPPFRDGDATDHSTSVVFGDGDVPRVALLPVECEEVRVPADAHRHPRFHRTHLHESEELCVVVRRRRTDDRLRAGCLRDRSGDADDGHELSTL